LYTYGDMPSPVPAPSDDERDPRMEQHATYQYRVLENARYFQGKALLTPSRARDTLLPTERAFVSLPLKWRAPKATSKAPEERSSRAPSSTYREVLNG